VLWIGVLARRTVVAIAAGLVVTVGMLAIVAHDSCMTSDETASEIVVPGGMEERRPEILQAVQAARTLVAEFADRHGWQAEARVPGFARVEVFADQQALWRRVLELNELDLATTMPTDGLVAAIEHEVLLLVVPEEYARIRPEYARDPEAFVRLIAHELLHRLHVRILGGNEDQMGPQWFYEGFAVVGAGQAETEQAGFASIDEALRAVEQKGRGSYARYGAAVRLLMTRAPLEELVERARTGELETWARGLAPLNADGAPTSPR
jgi:hypothetical protein